MQRRLSFARAALRSSGSREGIRAAVLMLALLALALLPARWVLSGLAVDEGQTRAPAFIGGLLVDVTLLTVPVMLLAGALMLPSRRRRWWGWLSLSLFGLVVWTATASMAESRISRGVFPSWVDVAIMWRSPAMMGGSLDMFLLPRQLLPAVIAVPLAALLVVRWPRPRPGSARQRLTGVSAVLAGAVAAGQLGLLAIATISLPPNGNGPPAQDSPLSLLSPTQLPEWLACITTECEPKAALLRGPHPRHAVSDEDLEHGAALLGWPARPMLAEHPPGNAAMHPYARLFPALENKGAAPCRAAELMHAMSELSMALFGAGDRPIHVWQVALEGVRADDVHAQNPAAPIQLAPQLSELYARADAGELGVLASRRTWTAGVRTPQGVSALLCGLGTLPYGLALSRDLPDAKLRCLPDVLSDAGFVNSYAYGGSPAFDRMGQFMAMHGLSPIVSDDSIPADASRVAWGLTDRVVFDAAIAATPAQSSYTFVLSLSHHHPFVLPDDMPAAVAARVEPALGALNDSADEADRRRLVTLAYTDAAVQQFLDGLSRAGVLQDSVILISADHPIPDRALWRHRSGALLPHQRRGLIPFVMLISPAFVERAISPERARAALARVAQHWSAAQLSQNDLPTLLLALLEHAAPLSKLPQADRWHSLGGQSTSPWYRPPKTVGSALHGIHAATALYQIDAFGNPTAADEPASLMLTPALLRQTTPSLQLAAAALNRLPRRTTRPAATR